MLANLPVEIILLICQYPEFKDLGQLAWTNRRMMQIIKKYLPTALDRKFLLYLIYKYGKIWKGITCLFDSHTNSVDYIAKFTNYFTSYEVATTKDRILAVSFDKKSFEVFDLNTRQINKGPNPPEWRSGAFVAYFKGKLYYLGGWDPKTYYKTNRVDVLIDGEWQTGPAFPLPIHRAQTITCDGVLYVIDGYTSKMIYRLSDDKQEWIETGEIPEQRYSFGVTSLNGKIYITGGVSWGVSKTCLCFDPSAPVGSRISRIADMNYPRLDHSLIVVNGKLYAIGGFQERLNENCCDSIEEYDPQTNEWREVGEIYSHTMLFYLCYQNNGKEEGKISLFNSFACSVEEIAKFHNNYEPYQIATTQNKILGIDSGNKSFEIYDLNTRQISRGPDPPEWRNTASVAYFKDKLYYLGGDMNRVDVLIDGIWQTGPAFPFPITDVQTITCDEILYVIDGWDKKIYRLSDDEREWIEVGEIPERRIHFEVSSLNGKIYITGGRNDGEVFKSCWCFDPSAPVDSRISKIADMNYARHNHSLVVSNEKLYAIGGYQKGVMENFCNSIEEYDPHTNEWCEVGEIE